MTQTDCSPRANGLFAPDSPGDRPKRVYIYTFALAVLKTYALFMLYAHRAYASIYTFWEISGVTGSLKYPVTSVIAQNVYIRFGISPAAQDILSKSAPFHVYMYVLGDIRLPRIIYPTC